MIKKQYVKSRKVAKLTFEVPKGQLPGDVDVASVHLVGDFNGWDEQATPMTQRKDGTYKALVEVEPGKKYAFRYLANGKVWFNDWEADGYMPGELGPDNCLVEAPSA